ncbi:hypothetical protein N9250_00925 [bacterium]|nr:hypothetical protein [bacterium]
MPRFKLETSPQPRTVIQSMWANAPFPQQMLFSEKHIRIESECGQQYDPTGNALSWWPDKSIQWLELVWKGCPCCNIYWVSTSQREENETANTEAQRPQNNKLTTRVKHDLDNLLNHIDLSISVELASGKKLELKADKFLIAQTQTALNEWDMVDEQGVVHCRCLIQVKPLSGTALQAWTVILRNPKKAIHPGGIWELGDPNSLRMRHATVRFEPKKNTANSARSLIRTEAESEWISHTEKEWRLEQSGCCEDQRSSIHRTPSGLSHDQKIGYRLHCQNRDLQGLRANPSAVIAEVDGERSFGIHCKNFWEKFPQALSLKVNSSLHYEFLPSTHHEDHELQGGEQISCEFLLAQGTTETVQSMLDDYSRFQTLKVDPEWITKSRVIPWLTPRETDDHQSYLALVDQAITGHHSFFEKREQIGQYGWRHFGDVWGDHEAIHSPADDPLVSHYNNQYDMVLGLGINYLRSGDSRWFELMRDLARHVIDIDIYHTDDDLNCYNHGIFWHTVHYVDAGLSTHRTYPKGTCGGGPSSGHAYNRGLYLFYCLTGDQTAKEAVVKMGEWMIASEDGSKTKYRHLAGGETGLTTSSGSEYYHGPGRGSANCVEVLVTAFEATQNRKYMDQAEHIIRRVVHPEQNIDALDLLDSEKKWFYLMFLQALGRYLEVKISMKEIDDMYTYGRNTLLHYADWICEHEYPFLDKPEKLEFPTETWAAQDMRKTEVLQWAARHASGIQKATFLRKATWYFDESVRQLNSYKTKSLCRPVALLLANGYSHNFFTSGKLDDMDFSPHVEPQRFPPEQVFASQKTRAIKNFKIATAFLSALVILALILFAVYMLQNFGSTKLR